MEFAHLTWDDLDHLTREQLMERIGAEREVWNRRRKRGLRGREREAEHEFTRIVFAVLPGDGLAQSMQDTAAWMAGRRYGPSTWMDEVPGNPHRTPQEELS